MDTIINTQLVTVSQGVYNFLQLGIVKVDVNSILIRIRIHADTTYHNQSTFVIEKTSPTGWFEVHRIYPYTGIFTGTILNNNKMMNELNKICENLIDVAKKILFDF